jgi:mono/diheme cytochrome c family protein
MFAIQKWVWFGRMRFLPAALLVVLMLAGCTGVDSEATPTQITPDFPSEPPATFTPPPPTPEMQMATVTPQATVEIPTTGEGLVQVGADIFEEACAACHQPQGQGIGGVYPPLNGSGFVTAQDPEPIIRVIITGRGGMPTFHDMLEPDEIAAVVSYIRGAWDNQASPVEIEQVEQVWQTTGLPLEEEEDE